MKHYQDLDEINEKEIKFTRNDIFDDVEEIEIGGNFFVLTGTFTSGKRKDIENIIKQFGGKVQSKITKSTDYLVVGEVTTRDWKYGNYGTKIEKALEWRNQTSLKIIPEQVLMKSLKSGNEKPHTEYLEEIFNVFLKIEPIEKVDLNTYEVFSEVDKELSEELGITVYSSYENFESYQEFILRKLNAKVKFPMFYLPIVKAAYEKLSSEEKNKLNQKLKEKLESYLKNSLTLNFKDIRNYVFSAKKQQTKIRRLENALTNLIENFGPFSNTNFVYKQIEKFKNEIKNEIESH